jgi:hypothetical protein
MPCWQYVVSATAAVAVTAGVHVAHAQQRGVDPDILNDTQIQYNRGLHVAPIYEGWYRNPDGSIDMWFGYLNLNWEEVLHVPVGPDNRVDPGGPDQGQPTVFTPRRGTGGAFTRRESYVFSVRLPSAWGEDDELVWTVTANGKTDRAIGLLLDVYELDTPADENEPPTIEPETTRARVTLLESLRLAAAVSDDGKPENRRERANVRWIVYRGPGRVTFDPAQTAIPADTETVADVPVTTTATFSEPGTYVLRAEANDGSVNAGGTPVIPSTGFALVTVDVESAATEGR